MAQALHLANGKTINEKLRSDASVAAQVIARKETDCAIIDRLFLSSLSRHANPAEQDRMKTALKDCAAGQSDAKAIGESRRQAVEDLYWAVLTCQEFLFNH